MFLWADIVFDLSISDKIFVSSVISLLVKVISCVMMCFPLT